MYLGYDFSYFNKQYQIIASKIININIFILKNNLLKLIVMRTLFSIKHSAQILEKS